MRERLRLYGQPARSLRGYCPGLAEYLQRIAAVSFANAAYAEVVGVGGAAEARERGGRLRQLAVRMGGVETAAAADRWNALLGDVREEVAADDTLYARAAAAAATARRNLFDDIQQVVEEVAAAATRTRLDFASRAVMDAAQNRLVALRARLSAAAGPANADAASDEAATAADLNTTAGGNADPAPRDPFAALDRTFEAEAAAEGMDSAAADEAPGSVEAAQADPFAALERAFAARRGEFGGSCERFDRRSSARGGCPGPVRGIGPRVCEGGRRVVAR